MLLSIIMRDTSQSTHVSPWDTTSPFGWILLYWRAYLTHGAHCTPQCRHPCRQSSAGASSSHRLRRPPIRCLNSEVIRTCVSPISGDKRAKVECAQHTSRLTRLLLSQCTLSAHIITRMPPSRYWDALRVSVQNTHAKWHTEIVNPCNFATRLLAIVSPHAGGFCYECKVAQQCLRILAKGDDDFCKVHRFTTSVCKRRKRCCTKPC